MQLLRLDLRKGCPHECLGSSPLTLLILRFNLPHSQYTLSTAKTRAAAASGVLELLTSPGAPLPHRGPAGQGLAVSGHTGRSQDLGSPAIGQSPLAGRNTGAVGNPERKCSAGQELWRELRVLPTPPQQIPQLGKVGTSPRPCRKKISFAIVSQVGMDH